MTADEFCVAVLAAGVLNIDVERGTVRARRFHDKTFGCLNTMGYRVGTLHLNGERKQVKLHRLIWISVHGLPPAGLPIDHINRDKADNRIGNLRLVQPVENAHNRRTYVGVENPAAKINHAVAADIRQSHERVKSLRLVALEFGVSASLVGQIIRGERWTS